MKRALLISCLFMAILLVNAWANENGTNRKIHKREINHTRAGMAKYGKNKDTKPSSGSRRPK